ncbi:FAD binding domain protein [Mycobacterium xenopi 3993]|nr:FAD binding domain protein [Mycobacterium xenopi 3993]
MAHEISRQTFCGVPPGHWSPVQCSVRFGPPGLNPSGWEAFARPGGHVVLPDGGAQFATAKQVFNTNYNGLTPAAIVVVSSLADVQKAMAFAAAHNVKVAPRSGGHSYIGASTANGTMVVTCVSCREESISTPPPDTSR